MNEKVKALLGILEGNSVAGRRDKKQIVWSAAAQIAQSSSHAAAPTAFTAADANGRRIPVRNLKEAHATEAQVTCQPPH